MEYSLILEQRKRYLFLGAGVIFLILLTFAMFFSMGIFGLLDIILLLFFLILTPFLYKRNKFFLVLWLFIVPVFDNFRPFVIAGANPMTVIGTVITVPTAMIILSNYIGSVWKKLPYIKYIFFFMLLLIFNCFRQDSFASGLMNVFRYFIQIFIIYLAYDSFKDDLTKAYSIFKLINIFTVINSIVILFQRLTGFGLLSVGGVLRAPGLLAHPNVTAIVVNLYLPMAIYMLMKSQKKEEKFYWGISIILNVLALLLTLTKVGYLCFLVMLFLMFLCLPYKRKLKAALVSICIFVLLTAVNFIFNLQIIEGILIRMGENDSYTWRQEVWKLLMAGINSRNVWFGNGIDSASSYLLSLGQYKMMTHNVYLQLWFELGVTCIIFYMSFIFPLISFIKAFMNKRLTDRMEYIFPIAIFVQIFINMYSDNSVFSRTPMFFAWVIITYFYMKLSLNLDNKNKKYA